MLMSNLTTAESLVRKFFLKGMEGFLNESYQEEDLEMLDIKDLKSRKEYRFTDYRFEYQLITMDEISIIVQVPIEKYIIYSSPESGALPGENLQGGSSAQGLTKNKKYKGAKGDGSECQDAEGKGGGSDTSQDLDGGGVGSSSGGSQGPDSGEGSASGKNQGGDGNSKGNGLGDGGDEPQGGLDLENGGQENNKVEIDIHRIIEIIMAILLTITIAAVDFHYNGFISTMILGLLIAINVFGFVCCMTSMLHRHRNPRVARIFGTIGAAAGSFGFLLLVSVPFSSYYPWMIFIVGSLAILVIFVLAFMS